MFYITIYININNNLLGHVIKGKKPRHTFHSIHPMFKVTLINALLNIQRTVFNRLGELHIINNTELKQMEELLSFRENF